MKQQNTGKGPIKLAAEEWANAKRLCKKGELSFFGGAGAYIPNATNGVVFVVGASGAGGPVISQIPDRMPTREGQ